MIVREYYLTRLDGIEANAKLTITTKKRTE